MADAAEEAAVSKGDEKRRLVEIDVDEISLVDKGANRRQFLVIKSEDGKGGIETMAEDEKDVTKDVEGTKDGTSPSDGDTADGQVKKDAEPKPAEPDKTEKAEDPKPDPEPEATEKADPDPAKMVTAIKSALGHLEAATKALSGAAGYGYASPEKRDDSPTLNDLVAGLQGEVKKLTETMAAIGKRDETAEPKGEQPKVEDVVKAAVQPLVDRMKKIEENIVGESKGEAADETDAPVAKSDKSAVNWTGVL